MTSPDIELLNDEDRLVLEGGLCLLSSDLPTQPNLSPSAAADCFEGLRLKFAELLSVSDRRVILYDTYEAAAEASLKSMQSASQQSAGRILGPTIGASTLISLCEKVNLEYFAVDIEPDSLGISPRGIAQATQTESTDIVGVIIAHPFGHPANMPVLLDMLSGYDLPFVQECSESFLSSAHGELIGTTGIASIFSVRESLALFHNFINDSSPTIVVFGDDQDDELIRRAMDLVHLRYTEDEMRIIFGAAASIESRIEHRRRLSWELNFRLRGIASIAKMSHARKVKHNYSSFVLRIRGPGWRKDVSESILALNEEGLDFQLAINPDYSEGYRDFVSGQFPVTDRIVRDSISLNLHEGLNEQHIEIVGKILRRVAVWASKV
jgi:dTDP-4-amino-4,6-dideoxygalactose transaminase